MYGIAGPDGEKTILNTSLAAKGALGHRLQHRTAYKIQNGRQGAPKWPGKVSTPRFWAFYATSAK